MRRFYAPSFLKDGGDNMPRLNKGKDEEIIARVKALAKELGRTPTLEDIDKDENLPDSGYILRRFEGKSRLLRMAGLEVSLNRARPYKAWTEEQIISAFQSFYNRAGHSPNLENSRKCKTLPNEGTVRRVFGSWGNALRAAGLPINKAEPRQK